jgi:ABC-2 type transport system ATP-binding protein
VHQSLIDSSFTEAAEPEGGQPSPAPAVLPLVSVSDLTKTYGARRGVTGITFELGAGVTGLLGPNGAGKSTLVRCLAGLSGWDDGEIRIAGVDPSWRAGEARGQVGFMPERVSFPPEMRVEQYLRFAAEGKGLARSARRAAVGAALERAGLEAVRSRIISNLSKGYRQRVGLAQALLGDPPVLILDEPSAGLDPLNVIEIRSVLQCYGEERAVLVSTHSLGETRQLCSRVLLLSSGQLVYDGSTAGMTAAHSRRFRVTALRESTGETVEQEMLVEAEDRLALGRQVAALSASGWLVTGVEPVGDALEDAFRAAVGSGPAS